MSCEHCNDTGSLSKRLSGHLDCPHCDIADERMRLEAWARRTSPGVHQIDAWLIYQHGKAAAAGQQQ